MSRGVSGNPGPRSSNALVNGLTKLGMFSSLLNVHELIEQQMITCWDITQLLHQPLHVYKIYKTLHIKTLETLLLVSVLRPSLGSYNFLAKVTLEIAKYSI